MGQAEGLLRIGELSQRTGVSPELLRAWQRRYSLLQPERSPGGFRLYSPDDEARVLRMKEHMARGIAAAQAARLASSTEPAGRSQGSITELHAALGRALGSFDESGAQRVLDEAFDAYSLDAVIGDLLIPYLHELGERWSRGEVTVAQEHFASNLIRARLLGLARGWDAGYGPRALLACPERELHDLGLVLFGVALARRGWRITFLGAHTPLDTLASTAESTSPDTIVLAASDPDHLAGQESVLSQLSDRYRLILAGRGAVRAAVTLGVELLDMDPVSAADEVARGWSADQVARGQSST